MLINLESRAQFFVNQLSLNKTFKNRKRYARKRGAAKKVFNSSNIDEKISCTEHLNILDEYREELKFLCLNKKNSESTDNSPTIKENSTRDTDIVICVESNSPESIEKYDESENFELQKFKCQKYNGNENNINIYNLLKLRDSLSNKNVVHYNKISNLIDGPGNELKKSDSINFTSENEKIGYENMKKIIDPNKEENGMIKQLINKYYHFNFNHSNTGKLVEKISNFFININNIGNKSSKEMLNHERNELNSNKNKKDFNSYSNILIEKMNNNNYKSFLSMIADKNYMNSIMYVSNKYAFSGEKMENNLIQAIKENKKILVDFKETKKEIADSYDLKILNDIFKNKKLRKKVKSNFGFLKYISEKKFYNFINENYFKNCESLTNEIETKNVFNYLDKSDSYNFCLFVYFLLGINYINKSKLNLSENKLFSLIQYFMKSHKLKDKNNKSKKERNKKLKLKTINKVKKNNNIIRINLEEVFGEEINNNNSMNLIEENENLNKI